MAETGTAGPEAVLAQAIRAHRARLNITAQQLADRITDLDGDLSRQAVSRIENGDRSVSVGELLVLAKALGTSPLLLLFPVGTVAEVEYLPGKLLDTWQAALWFTGEAYDATGAGTDWTVPLYLFRQHRRRLMIYDETKADDALREVRSVRAEMRRHGLTPPTLPDDLAVVDDQRCGQTSALH